MSEPLLTIAIPTYNRPEQLQATLEAVLPQLNEHCRLMVLDNCSEPEAATLPVVRNAIAQGRLTVVRHPVNIGGNSNILRCFELCATPYLWILSDDDRPRADAIAVIERTLAAHPDVAAINFGSELMPRERDLVVRGGLEEFLLHVSPTYAIWLSAGIHNMTRLRKHITMAHVMTTSFCPQWVPSLMAMTAGEAVLLSREAIADFEAPEEEQMYFRPLLYSGFVNLLHLPLGWGPRRMLGNKLADVFRGPESFWAVISKSEGGALSRAELHHLFRFACREVFIEFGGWKRGLRARCYLALPFLLPLAWAAFQAVRPELRRRAGGQTIGSDGRL